MSALGQKQTFDSIKMIAIDTATAIQLHLFSLGNAPRQASST
jgi:hypothetical protein